MPRLTPSICLLATALAACDDAPRGFDPYPIGIDLSAGPVLAGADIGDGPRVAVIDTLSPITIVDQSLGRAPDRRIKLDLTLLGRDPAGQLTIPRARFYGAATFDLHGCSGTTPCPIGVDGVTREVSALIGADLLSRSAVRFDFPAGELRLFPDQAGTDGELGDACEAVFERPYLGGGTLLVAGTEVPYGGNRAVVGGCADVATADHTVERGTDLLLVLATGLGPTVLGAVAYDRYAAATGAPARATLPDATLHLISGGIAGKRAELGQLALTASLGAASKRRGPCRELFLNRVMAEDRCDKGPNRVASCPCADGNKFCQAASAVDLDHPIEVMVIDDAEPILQSLRDELRPEESDVDGLLGSEALADLQVDLDYPNARLMLRCDDPSRCTTRPAVRSRSTLASIAACRAEPAVP